MSHSDRPISPFDPVILIYSAGLTGAILGGYKFYRNRIRRFPTTKELPTKLLRKRYLYGKVTSVGDGDNFHFYHLPGGPLAGWGWLRKEPEINKFRQLKNQTIHVRLCGVDAPERSHFGKPAQPFSDESLDWLRKYILGKKVFVKPLHMDQYNRVVSKARILKPFWLKDISEEMLRNGIAMIYESKQGGEFDGKLEKYKKVEAAAKKKKLGMWGTSTDPKFMTPRQYKNTYK
ncbi:unnamed protein product [Ambrosiozyma monospora]|uniref:Probable endonuclease LCL3 n=1 Tax=Ambrosiozyma monospora TaxID=43982 RepID=A0A9W6YR47_AMBMO|nr:unnamed protein product [Ambrosiozyma monospora]